MYNTRGLSVHSTVHSTQYRVQYSTEYRVDSPDLVVLDRVEGKLFEDVGRLINVQHQRSVGHVVEIFHSVQAVVGVLWTRVVHYHHLDIHTQAYTETDTHTQTDRYDN